MPTYTVRKTYQYSSEVEIVADTAGDAINKAMANDDDEVVDCQVIAQRDDGCHHEWVRITNVNDTCMNPPRHVRLCRWCSMEQITHDLSGRSGWKDLKEPDHA